MTINNFPNLPLKEHSMCYKFPFSQRYYNYKKLIIKHNYKFQWKNKWQIPNHNQPLAKSVRSSMEQPKLTSYVLVVTKRQFKI